MSKKTLQKKKTSGIDVRARSTIIIRPVQEIDFKQLSAEIVRSQATLDKTIDNSTEYDFILPRKKQRSAKQLIGMAIKNM